MIGFPEEGIQFELFKLLPLAFRALIYYIIVTLHIPTLLLLILLDFPMLIRSFGIKAYKEIYKDCTRI